METRIYVQHAPRNTREAQPSIRVPSTKNCPMLRSDFTSEAAINFSKNLPFTCWLCSCTRFLVKVDGC